MRERWPPEKSLRVLRGQLEKLNYLRGLGANAAVSAETEWEQLTLSVLEHAFGHIDSNVVNFMFIKRVIATSPEMQHHFFSYRINQYEGSIKAAIARLELVQPESEVRGAYAPGDQYEFYLDLRKVVRLATAELFVVDAYMDAEIFDAYVGDLNSSVKVRMLTTDKHKPSLLTAAKKFSAKGNFELSVHSQLHDRFVFADSRCWAIGQSLKDAASKQPTYLVEIQNPAAAALRELHDHFWRMGTVLTF